LGEAVVKYVKRSACILLLFLFAFVPDQLLGQSKIKVAYSSITGNQAPLWIARDRGIFKKNGLEVELIFIEGGSRVVQAMVAGDAPLAHVGATPIVVGNLRGADSVMIAATVNKMLFQFFAARDVSRPEDLKGKRVGISRFGSGSDFALRAALKELGLEPNKDVAILQLGTTPIRMAALESGAIQGTVLLPPETLLAKKRGYRLWVDLAATDFEFLNMGVATSRAFAKSQPDIVRRVTSSYVEGIRFFKTQESESMRIVARHTRTGDQEILKEIYELYQRVFMKKPYVSAKGIQNILDDLGQTDPKAKGIRAQSMFDNRFLKELDESGFIDRLYQ
jgi:NitT/TauT family transport system substrate-binding protein